MCLLYYSDTGAVCLTRFVNDIPPYTILSHTWGAEEVTLKELNNGADKCKGGYKKICFCGEQARRNGLSYFWVDTCCIDKENAAELQEAIKSMFLWYRNASQCYVYLSNMSSLASQLTKPPGTPPQKKQKINIATSPSAQPTEPPWQAEFQKSRWFTRG